MWRRQTAPDVDPRQLRNQVNRSIDSMENATVVSDTVSSAKVNVAAQAAGDLEMPQVSRFLLGGFHWYLRRLLRKNFNAVRIAKGTRPALHADQAVVCFVNHPGWWDPLLAFLSNQLCFRDRTVYTPIDKKSLAQYPVFRRLGFYGIDMDSIDGARQFLGVTRRLLQDTSSAIWITPGGRFSDVRQRTSFQPGLAHIAASRQNATLLPVAFEYTFWEERTPEALIEFGAPIDIREQHRSKADWQGYLEDCLERTQASLAEKVISRDYQRFDLLLGGSAGVGGVYDVMRRARALIRMRAFNPRHGRSEGISHD